ncbi:MAG: HpcH/HpaI aldolase family protein [Gammaproteobacteria bacterium]
MNAEFRRRLLAGDRLYGTMVTLDAPAIVELLGHIGFDWLFIETEHAPLLPHAVQSIIATAGQTPCLVRLSRSDEISIKRALDAGAAGIIVPQVNSAAHARLVVSYAKFAPMGSRGIGLNRASMYGANFAEYLAEANDATTIIVQAEHVDAVENIEEICAVEGIDGVLIGPYDLSASLNKTGRLNDREVLDAMNTVRDACLRHGMRLGFFGATPDLVTPRAEEGYTLLCGGADVSVFGAAARTLLDELRGVQG